MTGTLWFWRHDGEEGGPVTWDGLMALARAGKLRSTDPVLRQGTNDWIRAEQARSEGPPGLPPAPAMYAPPYGPPAPYAAPAPYPGAAYAGPPMAPPPGMYGGPTSGALAAMGRPSFMPMPSAEMGYEGTGSGSGESYQGLAVASLVCAFLGLFCFGWAFGLAAVGCGSKALSGMNTSGNHSGRGLAIAGIVLGVIDVVAVVLMIVLRAAAVGSGGY